jgi:ligand-binding sensor domain-containing protein/signal transduction histidine kinase
MRASERLIIANRVGWAVTLLLVAYSVARAERLPIRTYTTIDGLESSFVNRILQDSRGFMWFSTRNGLSRFDGYQFITYNTAHGLPHSTINFLLESRSGIYWVATNGGGVCRFNLAGAASPLVHDQARPLFTVYPVGNQPATNRVNILYEDRARRIWAGTDDGLFRLEETGGQAAFRSVEVGLPRGPAFNSGVNAIMEDRHGTLWVGINGELHRLLPNGHTERYTARHGLFTEGIWSLLEDRNGRIWVGAIRGLYLLTPEPDPDKSIIARRYTTIDGLAGNTVLALSQLSDGRICIGTTGGLTEFDGVRMRSYTRAHGLSEAGVNSIIEDRDGNLWMGTYGSGVMKLIRNGFTSYGEEDGPGFTQVYSILEDDRGALFTIGDGWHISHFDKGKFTSVRPNVPEDVNNYWMPQIAYLDRNGEWWVANSKKLYRFPKVGRIEQLAHIRPKAIYTPQDGLPDGTVHRFFEDSRGDLWLSIPLNARNKLVRWERATETFHEYEEADGLLTSSLPFAFCEDHAGALWIGFYDGGVARYRRGRFTIFTKSDGWPAGVITNLFLDHSGRLWVASNQSGLSRIDDPTIDHPKPINYTTAEGLSSNDTRCFTEDQWGRIYVGTVSGVDRLDPSTGRIKHYTLADGLSTDFVICALRDHRGWLWFGTMKGLSRLIPEPDRPATPPSVLITGLRVAGVAYSVSELGQTEVTGLKLEAHQSQVQLDFTALAFALGEGLRFRYKLEGADSDWNALTSQRTINYASLRPGNYRFVVQAVNSDGHIGPVPAVVAFTIRPPFWQRWWFIALTMAFIGSGLYALYRYRLARLLEMERVRTRIAADLHDDIGSSLSQIAIISEVLHKQIKPQEQSIDRNLSLMARVSREAVDSMSDIVWAINPQRDHMHDLVRRMRRFASETFPARDIDFSFQAPGAEQDLKLDADVRRQVFLIFKEGVNNIVRHSGCGRAEIEMRIEGPWLMLKIADNGQGIANARFSEGNGLMSMRRRAESLGGKIDVASGDGGGTTIVLKVLHGHRVGIKRPRLS